MFHAPTARLCWRRSRTRSSRVLIRRIKVTPSRCPTLRPPRTSGSPSVLGQASCPLLKGQSALPPGQFLPLTIMLRYQSRCGPIQASLTGGTADLACDFVLHPHVVGVSQPKRDVIYGHANFDALSFDILKEARSRHACSETGSLREISTSRRAIRMWHPCFDAHVSNPRATLVARSDCRGTVRNPGRPVAQTDARAGCARANRGCGSEPRHGRPNRAGACRRLAVRATGAIRSRRRSRSATACRRDRGHVARVACDSRFAPPLSQLQE